ncbi:hypothetical protein TSOC_008060 [Tetrabaena socialis]|uniref:Pherophorin domain-containing protein n=1 Tax=Tetrabaena socialis TaxID=47790 RepID=A0A2J7ZZF0_9CHLO|nr:hypothetical protein TSOC_008060 [Tetrabaena socialis]|eukprot:PNH05657.1 hypothetical protein TSOC_008060 [Tetrabaena socialis]
MAAGPRHAGASAILAVCALALCRLALASDPYASVTAADGSTYNFYRTDEPITAVSAAAACAATGGLLASLSSVDQVRSTVWSPDVVEAAASSDVTLLWTGLKVTWPTGGGGRRMLRSHAGAAAASEDDSDVVLARLIRDMDAAADAPPATTASGRAIPQELRAWMFQQRRRALRGADADTTASTTASAGARRSLARASDGEESPYLKQAVLSWADGAPTDLVDANPTNMGFLACNQKKASQCCGAVYDIGPDPYYGSDYPAVFFYPCNSAKTAGAASPAGYSCVVAPVAELPGETKSPKPAVSSPKPSPKPSPPPSPSGALTCSAGSQPAAGTAEPVGKRAAKTACEKCKAKTYSADGLKCRRCPAGTTSRKGASACA